ncbi:MAG: VOC family protein [Anaerolineae bacterium]
MLVPVLSVKSVEEALAYYTEVLGFEEGFRFPGPDGTVIHAYATWRDIEFMFGLAADASPASCRGVDFYIQADADIDAYYEQLKGKNVTIVEDLRDQFWGDRTFSIEDLNGYRLTFAKTVRQVTPEEMTEALKQMA